MHRSRLLSLLALLVLGCASQDVLRSGPPEEVPEEDVDIPDRDPDGWYGDQGGSTTTSESESGSSAPLAIEADCEGPIPVYAEGQRTDTSVCETTERFAVVSLADDWTPAIFDGGPEEGVPAYRDEYIALANEDFDALPEDAAARRYLELLGIFPTPTVLHGRLTDEARHECHDDVDDSPLEALDDGRTIGAEPGSEIHARSRRAVAAIETAQAHLVCDRLLAEGEFERGALDDETRHALRLFQRKQMIVGTGHIDPETATALARDSREQDFRAVLRMLRERVVDATGILADGSAQQRWGTVLDRALDPPEVRSTARQPAAPGGAPDRVSDATEAAAKALGLTGPEATAERLAELPSRVALPLPPRPTFDSAEGGEIFWVEIHRGAEPKEPGPDAPRPVLTLYGLRDERPVALVRWATTIGGYKEEETASGEVRTRYFESPLGRRLWRHVIATPSWLPPHDTPDTTLIRETDEGWELETAIVGPGYDSAYGLVMIIHELPQRRGGSVRFIDEGIRTHGSVSYRSILAGTSHGCHRMYNHLAVRLAGYLLSHRSHHPAGSQEVDYDHVVDHDGESRTLSIRSRGFRYDLERPVPVLVIDGEAPGPEDEPSRNEALD